MIESLHLKNFQCHDDPSISFDPLLTVLVGRSGAGKSAFLRGLRWVVFNRPQGDDVLQHDKSFVAANLVVDGHSIIRKKKGRDSLYALDGKIFHAVGTSVPEEISSLLNVSPESFSQQHDAAFLFSLTPGQVGNTLNSIVNLELIDSTLSNLSSSLKKAKVEVELLEERLTAAQYRKEELSWIEECYLHFQELKTQEDALTANRYKINQVVSLVEEGTSLVNDLQSVSELKFEGLKAIEVGDRVYSLLKRKEEVASLLEEMDVCILKLDTIRLNKKSIQDQLDQIKECPACGQLIPTLIK